MLANFRHRAVRRLKRLRRRLYHLRAYVPGLSRRHRMEAMVGPLGFWDALQRYQRRVLVEHGLQPGHRLLDIGCGPLQGGLAFIRYLEPGHYWGVDLDARRIEAAREQVAAEGLAGRRPHLIQSSTFGEEEFGEETFEYMWASQILYYFDGPAMDRLLAMVARRLAPGGTFLGDIIGPDHYEFQFPEHGLQLHTPEALHRQAGRHGLKCRSLGVIEQCGYPSRLELRTNLLLEFTRLLPIK